MKDISCLLVRFCPVTILSVLMSYIRYKLFSGPFLLSYHIVSLDGAQIVNVELDDQVGGVTWRKREFKIQISALSRSVSHFSGD